MRRSGGRGPPCATLMTPAYYVELMAVLTDQAAVIEKRTSGLSSAGLTDAH